MRSAFNVSEDTLNYFKVRGFGSLLEAGTKADTKHDIGPNCLDVVFYGAFGGVGDEEVIVEEGVVVISSSLDMLTNSCLGGIMVSLILLEGLDEEALVEFMVEWCEQYEDDDRNEEDDLFN
nr:hypothetical protein [Tanacetum cinerariifolium]